MTERRVTCKRIQTRPSAAKAFTVPVSASVIQLRWAITRSSMRLDDMPQGALPPNDIQLVEDESIEAKGLSTVLRQVQNNMQRFPHCVLLTRVGGFYELYFEHATVYAPLLNIKLAKRGGIRAGAKAVPMAGFPFYQLDRYLKILVQDLGKHVAISEEFKNDSEGKSKSGGLLFDRRVSRIITPGTLIDESFMDPFESNYILSVFLDSITVKADKGAAEHNRPLNAGIGLAWIDISSGDFYTQQTSLSSILTAVARIRPREVILDASLEHQQISIVNSLKSDGHIITYTSHPPKILAEDWKPMLEEVVGEFDPSAFTEEEVHAGGMLLGFIRNQLQGTATILQAPIRHQSEEFMTIDRNSIRALEIRSTTRDGRYQGSLHHAVKRTVTTSGTRLLTQRLS
jgi:DNA mismatch repair ATPase MutS